MDFTEFSVLAERTNLDRQLHNASRGAEVAELCRQRRDAKRQARRQRLAAAVANLSAAFNRSSGHDSTVPDAAIRFPEFPDMSAWHRNAK